MSTKFYRVKQTNFLWDEGAIIKSTDGNGYTSENEMFDHVDLKSEYISAPIIEAPENAMFFERVYPVNLLSKTVYKLKEEAKELLSKEYKS